MWILPYCERRMIRLSNGRLSKHDAKPEGKDLVDKTKAIFVFRITKPPSKECAGYAQS